MKEQYKIYNGGTQEEFLKIRRKLLFERINEARKYPESNIPMEIAMEWIESRKQRRRKNIEK